LVIAACRSDQAPSHDVAVEEWQHAESAHVKMRDPQPPLGEITDAYAFGRGFLVLDYSLGRVVAYDSGGSVQGTFGRVGSGPEEFRMLLVGSPSFDGSRVAILDPQNVSISIARKLADSFRVNRFPVRPSMGTIHYLEGDSLLAYTPFGRVSSPDTVFFVFREDGESVLAFGTWTKWSEGINSSISQLLTDVSVGQLVAAEAFGNRIAWYAFGRDVPRWEAMISEGSTMAAKMDSAVRRGTPPSKALAVGVVNARLWVVGKDSALVRQDTLVDAGRRLHRYVLITRSGRRYTAFGDLRVTDVAGREAIIAAQDDDGRLSLGRLPVSRILQRTREYQ
jgi:hypothetical protein